MTQQTSYNPARQADATKLQAEITPAVIREGAQFLLDSGYLNENINRVTPGLEALLRELLQQLFAPSA